ncbi:MAG: HAMP domain-containing histidine kinase [Gemmatimonadales bacterium]|nr:HAMP domain-containing histidine kinase [Gemmatimonadales bacterium]
MWYSLQFKVMAVVGAILIASIALLLAFTAGTHERQLLRNTTLHTSRISDLAARSIQPEMVAHRATEIINILDGFVQEGELTTIRLFDKEGTIALSTTRSEINHRVDMTHEMCIKCHDDGQPHVQPPTLERGRIFRGTDGLRRLAVITPIYNAPPCYECHDQNQEVLGVLDAVSSLEGVDRAIQRVRSAAVMSGGLAILFAWLGVAFVLQRFVRRPVRRLLHGTVRVAEGDLDSQITVSGQDELAQLSAAFNAMTAKLKRAGDQHARWNQQLEDKVRIATSELETANERLREADRRRLEFIRTVVHHLRAPVAGMQSFLRLITSQVVGELTPKQQQQLDRADRKCGLLLATVNDLLDIAAVLEDRSPRVVESVDLAAVTAACVKQFAHLAEQKGLTLSLDVASPPIYVLATCRDLEFAVANLLSNAVHYTPHGSVRVAVGQQNGDAVLTVSDTGIGIPGSDLPHCFREFYRGENVTPYLYEGTGLGLSIVKNVVDKYGGKIDLESELGTGTTVTVSIPAKVT